MSRFAILALDPEEDLSEDESLSSEFARTTLDDRTSSDDTSCDGIFSDDTSDDTFSDETSSDNASSDDKSSENTSSDEAPAPEPAPYELVDTADAVSRMVDEIAGLPNYPPSLYIDLEGHDLGRHGTVSIVQIYVAPKDFTYLVDTTTLGETAFKSPGSEGQTLKDILECHVTQKVFFDVRTDSDALFAHFRVRLAGIQDLQLMELATRIGSHEYLRGLARCIETDLPPGRINTAAWKIVKEKGRALFNPAQGGSFAVFDARPLSADILDYCVQDVRFLPMLWHQYSDKMEPKWKVRMFIESQERVNRSHRLWYNGRGPHMVLGPPLWISYSYEDFANWVDY